MCQLKEKCNGKERRKLNTSLTIKIRSMTDWVFALHLVLQHHLYIRRPYNNLSLLPSCIIE